MVSYLWQLTALSVYARYCAKEIWLDERKKNSRNAWKMHRMVSCWCDYIFGHVLASRMSERNERLRNCSDFNNLQTIQHEMMCKCYNDIAPFATSLKRLLFSVIELRCNDTQNTYDHTELMKTIRKQYSRDLKDSYLHITVDYNNYFQTR